MRLWNLVIIVSLQLCEPKVRLFEFFFQFEMRKENICTVACRVNLDAESAKNFKEKIDDEYRVHM